MTWLLIALLAAAALAPLGWVLLRPPRVTGRREADLSVYRAQLAELDRERAAGRLDEAAHRAAVLEVQRRLLAAPEEAAAGERSGSALRLVAAAAAVPVLALLLYLRSAHPEMPSATFALRQEIRARDDTMQAELRRQMEARARDEALLAELRRQVEALDQRSGQAREGWTLLANFQRDRGNLDQAAEAYRHALAAGFDPQLASQLAQVLLTQGKNEEAAAFLADALPKTPGHVGLRYLTGLAQAQAGQPEAARATWQALIADAPPGVPWKAMVERRMQALP